MAGKNIVDMTGKKIGRLTVIQRAENDRQSNAQWLCRCECGKETIVRGHALRQGRTKSCGCLLSEASQKRMTEKMTKHGMAATKLYKVYMSMCERCMSPSSAEYHRYGGRGITVCEEWKQDRQSFFKWALSNGYAEGLSIDRIDNNGNYCPENCRWVTHKENSNNTSRNVFLEYNGERHTLSEWSKITGINISTIYSRKRANKTPEQILSREVQQWN